MSLLSFMPAQNIPADTHKPDAETIRFAQISDTHVGAKSFSTERLNQVIAEIHRQQPAFVVHTGDIIESQGEVMEEWETCQKLFAGLKIPFYPLPGNHDTGQTPTTVRYERWQKYLGATRFSFQKSGVAFVGVDLTPFWQPYGRDLPTIKLWRQETLAWLQSELQKAQECQARFVFGHFPIYLETVDSSDESENAICDLQVRLDILEILAQGHCNVYFCGHTHFGWKNVLVHKGWQIQQLVAPSLQRPWVVKHYLDNASLQESHCLGWYLWQYDPKSGELAKQFILVPNGPQAVVVEK